MTEDLSTFKEDNTYLKIGVASGFIVGGLTFFGCWLYAIQSWGWFLGIAFGWLPSAIIAVIVGVLSIFLWGPALGLIAFFVLAIVLGW